MKPADILRLIALAAIWGGSFIFMRVLAPVLGPILTAELRVLIAGLALLAYFRAINFDIEWRLHWKEYFLIGAINSALPFFLYSFAALHIPASYSVILNSATPLFAAIFSALWLSERLTLLRIVGLIIGASGVVLVANIPPADVDSYFLLSVLACLLATVCYGLTAVYVKRRATTVKPMAVACASQIMAAMVLMPGVPFAPLQGEISLFIIANVLGLALICSAVAYLLYYRLIIDTGPTKALTVTFLMPAFGMVWGAAFLHEQITLPMIAGTLLILLGTGLVLNVMKRPASRRSEMPTTRRTPKSVS